MNKELVRLVSHPARMKALVVFAERSATPEELSFELGEPLGFVSHHVQELLGMGMIELVRTESHGDAVEHFYRATMPPLPRDEERVSISIPDSEGSAPRLSHSYPTGSAASTSTIGPRPIS